MWNAVERCFRRIAASGRPRFVRTCHITKSRAGGMVATAASPGWNASYAEPGRSVSPMMGAWGFVVAKTVSRGGSMPARDMVKTIRGGQPDVMSTLPSLVGQVRPAWSPRTPPAGVPACEKLSTPFTVPHIRLSRGTSGSTVAT
ncbi:hypothetical protein GCM10018954_022780 [Kutzneria kofuensis]